MAVYEDPFAMNFSVDTSCAYEINDTHVYYYEGCDHPCKPLNYTLPNHNKITEIRILGLVFLISSVFGIILTLIVLSRKHMCTSTNCYLISLSVADLTFLLLFSTIWLETEVTDYLAFDIYFRYADIFVNTFLCASVWVTVMLAIERYIAICHSLKANSICTVKRAVIINVCVYVISFILRIPKFFDFTLKTGFSVDCSKTTYLHPTPLWQNTTYQGIYALVVDCILCTIVPFLALLYLNTKLVFEVRKSTHYLMDNIVNDSNLHNVLGREQRRVTLMLISIVIVFFICQAPYLSVAAFRSIARYASYMVNLITHSVREVTFLLLLLKSSLNFVLYCWFSEKFWDTFKKELCRKMCMIFKRNRHMFSSRSQSDSHNLSQHKSLRKSSTQMKETVSTAMRDSHC